MNHQARALLWLLLIAVLGTGCAAGLKFYPKEQVRQAPISELDRLAEVYYSAPDVETMRKSVAEAGQKAPHSAIYHEIAADLAYLENKPFEQFDHLYNALLDPTNAAAVLHIDRLYGINWGTDEWDRALPLFELLATEHTDADVRARAQYYVATVHFRKGRLNKAREQVSQLGWRIPFDVIGPFDNDQGKGFDIAYPPERGIDLQARYQGYNNEVGWIADPVRGVLGFIDVEELMYPDQHVVVYAATAFDSAEEGEFDLRFGTGDALKVWVNGRLVFADKYITRFDFEGVVVRVDLRKGANTILIKSAHESGGWNLWGRITKTGNLTPGPSAFKSLPADTQVEVEFAPIKPKSGVDLVSENSKIIKPEGARAIYWASVMAAGLGLDTSRAEVTEIYGQIYPDSLRAQIAKVYATWNLQERAKTADMLDELAGRFGNELIMLSVKQARFWRQNNLEKNARELLLKIHEKFPDRPEAWFELDEIYDDEGWQEDRCLLMEDAEKRWPNWPRVWHRLSGCWSELDQAEKSLSYKMRYLEALPASYGSLKSLYYRSIVTLDYDDAEEIALLMRRIWPNYYVTALHLAEVLELKGDEKAAREILEKLSVQVPSAPRALFQLGQMDYLQRNKADAITRWKEALDRDPDNESLAHRLDLLAPEKKGPWAADIPTDEELTHAVALRETHKFSDKADVAYLLDHQVTSLSVDGSTSSMVTVVAHALNVNGQDRLTEYHLPRGGRTRIVHAYSYEPDGRRRDASSIRGKEIRFRQMQVGSTIVVQYRYDAPPNDLVGNYYTAGWSFQSPKTQFVDSRFVLWSPKETKLGEFMVGEIEKNVSDQGKLMRTVWSVFDSPVAVSEKGSVSPREYLWQLNLSTVPSWENFYNWEAALLKDVFRESPEIVALAKKVLEGAETTLDKLRAIQEFAATEIRYQQDYEHYISGVKPHSAPMVLARGYGDCKDKSVLFITLARYVGIKAQLALVRTKGIGPVRKETPDQQFNHAIVYVPKQEGLEQAMFFDATAETLDLIVLRGDDTGTESFVIDENTGEFGWVSIPFNPIDDNYVEENLEVTLNADGSASTVLGLKLQGEIAAVLRRLSRNNEQFLQVMQRMGNTISPGAEVKELGKSSLEDITSPAMLEVQYKMPSFARKEGNELRFKIPLEGDPMGEFALEERTTPLNLGNPKVTNWNIEVSLPKGVKVKRIPKNVAVKVGCIEFKRDIGEQNGKLVSKQEMRYSCDRVLPHEYAKYRSEMQKVAKIKDEDVVLISK